MADPFGPLFGGGASVLTSDLIRATRRYVQGAAKETFNSLSAQHVSGTDQLVLSYPLVNVQVGMGVEVGWVEYSVVDVDTGTKTLTVLPEIEGFDLTHAIGARVRYRPRYPAWAIIREINNDLADLSTLGIYRVLTADAVDGIITVPEDALVILDATSTTPDEFRLPRSTWRITDRPSGAILETVRDMNTAVFGCVPSPLSTTVDQSVAATTGLPSTAVDLPAMGAALRMFAGAEAQRNIFDSQGETRRANEVPPGALTGALRNLAALRATRVQAEAGRFNQRYGFKQFQAM